MATKITFMSTKITFKAGELKRILANGSLFAAQSKDCLPALETVRFDWDGDRLFAVATNRYVLSYEQAFPVSSEGRESFSIGTADIKQIIGLVKQAYGYEPEITVEYDGERWATFTTLEGNVVKVNTEHGDYPQWRRLTEGFKAGERGSVMVNTKWLALLYKVQSDAREPLATIEFNATDNGGPMAVKIGEHFRGLVAAW